MINDKQVNVTPEEVTSACAKLEQAGIDPLIAGRGQIRRVCGVVDRRARTIREWIRRSKSPIAPAKEDATHEVSADAWTISISSTEVGTLAELMSHCKVDPSNWDIQKFFTRHDPKTGLYHTRANFRRKIEIMDAREELESLKAAAQLDAKVFPAIIRNMGSTGNLLEINLPDLHMGKLCWSKETGWENYDSSIAASLFNEALDTLLQRTAGYQFDRVLFVVGNDLLHTDNREGLTTGGTPQNTDGRFQKTFKATREMKAGAIEILRSIAPVDVVMVPGNHDTLSVWQLGDSLQCYFHKCPDVHIDNEPSFRKYYQWDKNMFLLTHGNKGKHDDYPLLMAVEQKQMWADTDFREAHTGHTHQTKTQEYHGVRVRTLSALCPADAWHSENHYVGNIRSAEAFMFNGKNGLIGTAVHSIVNR